LKDYPNEQTSERLIVDGECPFILHDVVGKQQQT